MVKRSGTPKHQAPEATVLIAGDFCPVRRVEALAQGDDPGYVYGDLLDELGRADLSVVNVECPLTERGKPIPKDGPALRAAPATGRLLSAAEFDVGVLANNHIADFGDDGVKQTLATLSAHGMRPVGGGMNLAEARKPLTITRNGLKIRMLAVAEPEATIAEADRAGAAPLAPLANLAQIRKARAGCDVLLVIAHGGHEHNPMPSPRTVAAYRAFAEAGADAVIGSHPHTPQGYERHRGVPIFYSLGNFVFDFGPSADRPTWNLGYMVRLHLKPGKVKRFDIIGYDADREATQLYRLRGEQRHRFNQYLKALSEPLADDEQIVGYHDAWCVMQGPQWLARLRSLQVPWRNDVECDQFMIAANALTCPAHHDLLTRYMHLLRLGQLQKGQRYKAKLEQLRKGPKGYPFKRR